VCVEPAAEDADDVFSVVSYMMKIMFYIRRYPNETTLVMNCAAHAMNVLTMPNAISFTDSYKNVGLLTSSPANFL